jgi:hypothetical protein
MKCNETFERKTTYQKNNNGTLKFCYLGKRIGESDRYFRCPPACTGWFLIELHMGGLLLKPADPINLWLKFDKIT